MKLQQFAFAILLALPGHAHASDGIEAMDVTGCSVSDCVTTEIKICQEVSDYNLCAHVAGEQADAKLNAYWSELIGESEGHEVWRGWEKGFFVGQLRASQRAWIEVRDKTCILPSIINDGRASDAYQAECAARMTITRIEELRQSVEMRMSEI